MKWILGILLLFPMLSEAVLINEIAWMGSSVDEVNANQHWRYEWIELYTEEATNLDGWHIELYSADELYFDIKLSGSISAKGYFLVGASEKIPKVDVNYANLGGKLLNDGMRVLLKDNTEVVEEVSGWLAGNNKTKLTMERTENGWQDSAVPGGTPKKENSEGLKIVEKIVVSETKKDSSESFQQVSHNTPIPPPFVVPLALALSLGSAILVLLLARLLLGRA
jgi:hypothetical protein